jgi:(p)ppGpp synthase/HD superfamily hydrolase
MVLDQPRHQNMLALVQKYHAKQTRSGGVPYWHHLLSVAQILEHALEESKELKDKALLSDLLLAALGHDLYEDTTIDPKEIHENYGDRVHELIRFLTNEDGDDNRARYVAKMASAPEEAKLIKLADIVENTISVAYNLHDLGTEWAHSFFLPIVEEMKINVTPDKFKTYKKTAKLLDTHLQFSFNRLYENAQKFKS